MPIVEVPGMGDVEFPDDMSDEQIAAAIKKNLAPQETGNKWGRAVGLVGRAAIQGAGSLPMLPLDAGVAIGNFVNRTTGSSELPYFTQRFDQALTDVGFPEPKGALEKVGSLAISAATGAKLPMPVPKGAPPGFVPPVKDAVRQATLRQSQKAGYVTPPATTNPTVTNKMLESIAGKDQLAQEASLRNMQITDKLGRKATELAEDADITPDALSSVRSVAAQSYEKLRGLGEIQGGGQFSKDLSRIAQSSRGANNSFPGLGKNEIEDVVRSLDQPQFDASDAVDATRILRDNASSAFAKGDTALGKAYRAASDAVENAIERALEKVGNKELLKEFRDSRKLIAKTHSVEKALNESTGHVNATKLASQLAKGKPLSGPLKTAAQFGQAFPRAAREIVDSGPVRNTDVIFGAGTAALSREPSYLLYPFLRQAVRAGLLSNAGQRLAVPGAAQLPPGLLSGSVPLGQGLFQ